MPMNALRASFTHVLRAGPLVILALFATVALSCNPNDGSPRVRGVYAEVAVEVQPAPDDVLARLRPTGARVVVRWWYALDPVRWRWEIEGVGSIIDDGTSLTVSDGNDSWSYDDRLNVYQRGVFRELPDRTVLSPIFSAPVGPANVPTIDEFIERWRDVGEMREAVRAGEETILGRRTEVVEIRSPAGGSVRAYIDPERMFIMRWVVDGESGRQSLDAEVTTLDYDADIDVSRLTFDPPPGAREVEAVDGCSFTGSSGGEGAFHSERGFLRPAYAPPGYRSGSSGSQGSHLGDCRIVATWSLLESSDEAYILLYQRLRAGGIPQTARAWERVESDLGEVFVHSENGTVRLVWRAHDVVGLLEANSVTVQELLRIAESAELVP
ncbi:MAG: hypothetical protein OXC71_02945 [Chloroflexi bacterium]|nr:hypothetical protein [Chloroflexota bacterium]